MPHPRLKLLAAAFVVGGLFVSLAGYALCATSKSSLWGWYFLTARYAHRSDGDGILAFLLGGMLAAAITYLFWHREDLLRKP